MLTWFVYAETETAKKNSSSLKKTYWMIIDNVLIVVV